MTTEEFRHLTPSPNNADATLNPGRFVIAVIGIDAYEQWPKLHNAVSDALGVEKLFVEKLGFVNPIKPLLNDNATEEGITELVQDQLPAVLEPTDNLILFFAGHGHTRLTQVGEAVVETGYIVPVDARTDRWSDYVKIGSLLEDISQLPARHILLILDACHSGFALGSSLELHRSPVRYEGDLVKRRSRKAITSARRDQPAVDSGPVAGHSLFTGTLVDGFNWGTVDLDGNGLVTSFELGLYLQQRVGQASNAKQTPDFGSFHLDDRGEMVISLGDDNFDAVKARAFTALRYRQLDQFRQLVEQLAALRPQSPETLYLQYRLHFADGKIQQAVKLLWALQSLNLSTGTIPLSPQDIVDLSVQVPFGAAVLTLPPGELPVAVTLLAQTKEEPATTLESIHATKKELVAEELREAAAVASAVGRLYQVESGEIVRFRARNLTDAPAHLYYISITGRGTFRIGPLLADDQERIDGLAPGAQSFGPFFKIAGPPGIYETRIFYSPERISPLLFPPTTAMRGVSPPIENVENIKMQTILHEIVAAELPQMAPNFPGTEVR